MIFLDSAHPSYVVKTSLTQSCSKKIILQTSVICSVVTIGLCSLKEFEMWWQLTYITCAMRIILSISVRIISTVSRTNLLTYKKLTQQRSSFLGPINSCMFRVYLFSIRLTNEKNAFGVSNICRYCWNSNGNFIELWAIGDILWM